MKTNAFEVNQKFIWNGDAYTILNKVDDTIVTLKKGEEADYHTKFVVELERAWNDGELVFPDKEERFLGLDPIDGSHRYGRQLGDFSKNAQEEAKKRIGYLMLMEEDGPLVFDTCGIIEQRIQQAHADLGDTDEAPNRTTVYRWNKRWVASGCDPLSQVPGYECRGGAGANRWSKVVAEVVDKVIEEVFLPGQNMTVEALTEAIELRIERLNEFRPDVLKLKAPSQSTISRYITKLPPFEVDTARHGIGYAIRNNKGTRIPPKTKSPLEIIEIDETPLDLFVVDEEEGYVLGRPYLTVGAARCGGMPWGMHLSYHNPSTFGVLGCIAHGIKPKTYLKEMFPGKDFDWPVYGIPQTLRCDNALWYHGNGLKEAAFQLGINLEFCPKKSPNWKPKIEGFLKQMNYGFAHKMPGTSLSHHWKRKDYDPLKVARIDRKVLVKLIHEWVIGDYMNSKPRGKKMARIDSWKEKTK